MTREYLLKGFEVELFTGLATGEHVGVSADVSKDLAGFVKEPDQRNLEYITAPIRKYECLKEALLTPRRRLREWLAVRQLTLLPGSTLSLGNSAQFERSEPSNPYHDLIEATYGTRVVTTSIHINLGIADLPRLFSALRLVRCEAALFLSLSASSPFLDGRPTGAHSQRWLQFPLTPKKVPLFLNHAHYVHWLEDQLANGSMWNERHLWTSVRPNGPSRPHDLNRLELRICDCITNCDLLLAITALLELRLLKLFQDPDQLDPLKVSRLSAVELADLSDMNDSAAAQDSLDATLHSWLDGKPILCREWLYNLLENVTPLAKDIEMFHLLAPIQSVLDQGNQAMKWLKKHSLGDSVEDVVQESIAEMEVEEIATTKSEAILG
ncbi:glutamate--cysteine ligase [Prochlorococcus sp. MIT 1307]|uniref:glutamate--cysteine ligase n=1 Tax=Prochlorococcus sp. MIT 1307 TaxID=3096219 RepID=UPI002A761F90|nr:glutamate--cysteine ligase [Prochlorococcus sp. MIT 1307]